MNLVTPTPNKHGTPIQTTLTYEVPLGLSFVQIVFNPGLANSGGVAVKDDKGSNKGLIIVAKNVNEGTNNPPQWVIRWSKEYGGDL